MRGYYAMLKVNKNGMEYAQGIESLGWQIVISRQRENNSRTLIVEGGGGDEEPAPKSE